MNKKLLTVVALVALSAIALYATAPSECLPGGAKADTAYCHKLMV